jgi:hypothetical protein
LRIGGAEPVESTPDSKFQVEASVSGDFYDPADAPHTTIVRNLPVEGEIIQTSGERAITVLDMEPGPVDRRIRTRTRTARTKRAERLECPERPERPERVNSPSSGFSDVRVLPGALDQAARAA